MSATGVLLRLAAGGLLLFLLAGAGSHDLPRAAFGAALLIAAVTFWRPFVGLLLTLALAPAGNLFAGPPVRVPELFAAAFLVAWLLAFRRPLADGSWPRMVILPAWVYGIVLVGSWLRLTLGGAAGVAIPALPSLAFQMIPESYLSLSSPEPETWTLLQNLFGLGLFMAAIGIVAQSPARQRWVAWTLIASGATVAFATLGEVTRQWAAVGFEPWFVLRYVRGERFALHMADLNAAGSWFVMPVVAAAVMAGVAVRHRSILVAALLVMAPAFWLIHSRTAYLGIVIGLAAVWIVQRRRAIGRWHVAAAAGALAAIGLMAVLAVDWDGDTRGSAGLSARLRAEFLATSARMFRSAPILGVGIGRYFDRSDEFMSDELREIYGNENAHNYVAQQFAEGGVVGGLAFLWLAGSVLLCGVRSLGGTADAVPRLGLFGGVVAYLSTCLTGHPLLVPEAALPFWIVAGVVGAGTPAVQTVGRPVLALGVAASVIALAGVGQAAVAAVRTSEPPPEYGFHQPETDDGMTFRWIDRHAVSYVPNGEGFVRLRVRAPEEAAGHDLVLETSIAGRVADRRTVPADRWLTFDIPSRPSAASPLQRIDLRVNRWWTQDVMLGQRPARRPIAAKVAELRWIPLSEVP